MITQKELKQSVSYNRRTGVFTRKSTKKKAGAIDSHGYIQIKINGRLYLAHRLVWLWVYGRFPTKHIHHRNGKKTDNRFCNLEEVSQMKNNRLSNTRNNKPYPGVHCRSENKKYRAYINIDKKRINLGSYKTKKEAIEVRRQAEKQFLFYAKTRS